MEYSLSINALPLKLKNNIMHLSTFRTMFVVAVDSVGDESSWHFPCAYVFIHSTVDCITAYHLSYQQLVREEPR
jgi:hypothetical protein